MYRRPAPRQKIHTASLVRPTKDDVRRILKIVPREEREEPSKVFSVQNSELYLKLIKRNYEYYELEFKKPEVVELIYIPPPVKVIERHFEYPDNVMVKLNVLKSGKVRIKLFSHVAQLWEKYNSKGKIPPHKMLVSAYKSMGYSEAFINKMNKSFERKKVLEIKYEKMIQNIFERPSTKKKAPAKKKKKEEEPEEKPDDTVEEEPDDDDVTPEEDEAIEVDNDDDEDVDENADDVEPPDLD
tara:strand:+ start:337 stop:1059 length:723 start_codon:yes stop_codon:yes gene_type:complete